MKLKGTVTKGLQIGSKFGIATANIQLARTPKDLKEGVYYVLVQLDTQIVKGILHFGALKTFERENTCEVHLLDFEADIYDRSMEISLLKWVRPTRKFQNADALYSQIEQDVLGAEKYFIRMDIFKHWDSLSVKQKNRLAQKAISQIVVYEPFLQAKTVFIYAPQATKEIDFTADLIRKFPDKQYFFPRVEGVHDLIFIPVTNMKSLEIGAYGLQEPIGKAFKGKPDLIFLPSVGTDGDHGRLGRGGGFYDRYLDKIKGMAATVSVLPDFSINPKIPIQPHDQPVDTFIICRAGN